MKLSAATMMLVLAAASVALPIDLSSPPPQSSAPKKRLYTRKRHEGIFGIHNYYHRHPELKPPYAPVRPNALDEPE
ncbi:hypothetical protein GGI07_002245 [Coemansia sp. Benny D115]|nr:hypothetical protein GGI07_002245 [Coemansia sp. Benny D115]